MTATPSPQPSSPIGAKEKQPGDAALPLAVLLGALVLVTFLPAIHNEFINYDDTLYVVTNPHIQDGLTWNSLVWAFTHGYASNWHPLTWISHSLDCQFFGLRPWGHHLTSVLLHTVNALLVFAVWRRMTGAVWRSFLVAALFGLHPAHVESVAWVAERKDVLSAFFWMLTLWAYAVYVAELKIKDSKFKIYYGLALGLFVLGLLSKPMLVTLPFVLLLLDYWPLGRDVGSHAARARLVWEKIPFFALAAGSSVVTFLVQKSAGAMDPLARLTFMARLENALVSYCRYLGELFYPARLSVFYPYFGHWSHKIILLAVTMLAGITWLVIIRRRQAPALVMGWFWFAGTLVPVIGLVQVGAQSMADRYTYIPSIGLFVMVVWTIPEAMGVQQRKWALAGAGAAVILACAMTTWVQIGYWKTSETLFRHTIAVTPSHCIPHYTLGDALMKQGRLDEAKSEFLEALRLKPDYTAALNDLALVAGKQGHSQEAIAQLQDVIRANPAYVSAHYNLGCELQRAGRTDEAIAELQAAVRLDPDEPDARNNLGMVLAVKGRVDEAIEQFQAAVKLKPGSQEGRFNLAYELAAKGLYAEAMKQFQEILLRYPNDADAHFQLGRVLLAMNQRESARREFAEAVRVRPNFAAAEEQLRRLTVTPAP